MWEVLKDYPAARVRLEAIAAKRLEKYKKAPLEKGKILFCDLTVLPNLLCFNFTALFFGPSQCKNHYNRCNARDGVINELDKMEEK